MPRDFSERRAVSKVKRKPPTTQAEAFTELLAGVVALNECTPEAEQEAIDDTARDDEALAKALGDIAAGERLAEVVKRLRAISVYLQTDLEATRQRAGMVHDLITFAEKGE